MEGMVGRGPVLRGGACALEGGGFGRRGGIYMGMYLSTMVKPAVKRICRRKAVNLSNEREADQALRIPACGISVDLGISAHYAARSTRPEHPL